MPNPATPNMPPRRRWHPGMTDDEILARLAEARTDPAIQEILATAPKELAPDEAARIARLLWPPRMTPAQDGEG